MDNRKGSGLNEAYKELLTFRQEQENALNNKRNAISQCGIEFYKKRPNMAMDFFNNRPSFIKYCGGYESPANVSTDVQEIILDFIHMIPEKAWKLDLLETPIISSKHLVKNKGYDLIEYNYSARHQFITYDGNHKMAIPHARFLSDDCISEVYSTGVFKKKSYHVYENKPQNYSIFKESPKEYYKESHYENLIKRMVAQVQSKINNNLDFHEYFDLIKTLPLDSQKYVVLKLGEHYDADNVNRITDYLTVFSDGYAYIEKRSCERYDSYPGDLLKNKELSLRFFANQIANLKI